MVYLNAFIFPNEDMEFDFFMKIKRTCYDSFYPFKILSKHSFERIVFEPVTVLYGGNGSGKSTALNVIAEKTEIKRDSIFNKSNFFEDSARFFGCQFIISTHSPFLLAIPGAKIYDLDENPVDMKRWTELENVRTYYDFFKRHEKEF